MEKLKNLAFVLFIIASVLTILEFMFLQGLFTFLMVMVANIATGIVNIGIALKEKDYKLALLFLITITALNMGYIEILT